MARLASVLGRLIRNRQGAVATEYVVLLGTCGVAIAAAIVAWGPALYANYARSQGIILSPFP